MNSRIKIASFGAWGIIRDLFMLEEATLLSMLMHYGIIEL